MSNLNENIKKFVVEKIVDILELFVFLTFLFLVTSTAFTYGNTAGLTTLIIGLIMFYYVSKYTGSIFEKWETPNMDRTDNKKYLLIDTTYNISLVSVVAWLLWPHVKGVVLLLLFGSMVIIKEGKKWKRFITTPK